MRELFEVLAILVLCTASLARAQQSATTAPQEPIKIDVSQKAETPAGWEKWTTLVEKIAWPFVAGLGLILLRRPISRFLDAIGQRTTKISIGSLGIELPTMNQAQLGDDVLTFRTEDAFLVVSSSAKRSLFEMFEQPGKFEFVAINLGRGQSWLSSRLFIFAIMLQRMKSLRCIVFLSAGPDTETQFLGATTPEKVRWGLARLQPWLENAYAQASQSPEVGPLAIQNENGALAPIQAEQIVKAFLNLLINPPAGTVMDNQEWVVFASNQKAEHATWVSREYLEDGLGHIQASRLSNQYPHRAPVFQRNLFPPNGSLRMGENDFRKSAHNSQTDKPGIQSKAECHGVVSRDPASHRAAALKLTGRLLFAESCFSPRASFPLPEQPLRTQLKIAFRTKPKFTTPARHRGIRICFSLPATRGGCEPADHNKSEIAHSTEAIEPTIQYEQRLPSCF